MKNISYRIKHGKIVELKNLSKIYNTGEKEFKALDNIDLSIGKGEVYQQEKFKKKKRQIL